MKTTIKELLMVALKEQLVGLSAAGEFMEHMEKCLTVNAHWKAVNNR